MNNHAYKITPPTMKAVAAGVLRDFKGVQTSEEFYRRHISQQLEQLDLTALHIVLNLVKGFQNSQHWRNV